MPEIIDDFETVLEQAAAGLIACDNSLTTLEAKDLAKGVAESLPPPLPECLRKDVPEYVSLPGGRRCSVHYEPGQTPWIESRLQDFFGMAETPKIARGRIELTVHLLAPKSTRRTDHQRPPRLLDDALSVTSATADASLPETCLA
ncbi:MAG: ATP-dependent helicase C-terminal domain-containing protein [Polyangiaceae bacterium]